MKRITNDDYDHTPRKRRKHNSYAERASEEDRHTKTATRPETMRPTSDSFGTIPAERYSSAMANVKEIPTSGASKNRSHSHHRSGSSLFEQLSFEPANSSKSSELKLPSKTPHFIKAVRRAPSRQQIFANALNLQNALFNSSISSVTQSSPPINHRRSTYLEPQPLLLPKISLKRESTISSRSRSRSPRKISNNTERSRPAEHTSSVVRTPSPRKLSLRNRATTLDQKASSSMTRISSQASVISDVITPSSSRI